MRAWVCNVALITGILLASVIFSLQASAHVLVTDSSGEKGAILHIIPDDEPIAGEEAELFLDTQGGLLNNTSTVSFSVTRQNSNVTVEVPVSIKDSLVTAKYVFPARGVYVLSYDIATQGKQFQFEQTTRIAKGVTSVDSTVNTYPWAEGLLYIGSGLMIVVVIVFLNRRHSIAGYSKL